MNVRLGLKCCWYWCWRIICLLSIVSTNFYKCSYLSTPSSPKKNPVSFFPLSLRHHNRLSPIWDVVASIELVVSIFDCRVDHHLTTLSSSLSLCHGTKSQRGLGAAIETLLQSSITFEISRNLTGMAWFGGGLSTSLIWWWRSIVADELGKRYQAWSWLMSSVPAWRQLKAMEIELKQWSQKDKCDEWGYRSNGGFSNF